MSDDGIARNDGVSAPDNVMWKGEAISTREWWLGVLASRGPHRDGDACDFVAENEGEQCPRCPPPERDGSEEIDNLLPLWLDDCLASIEVTKSQASAAKKDGERCPLPTE